MKKVLAMIMLVVMIGAAMGTAAFADEAEPGSTADNPVEMTLEDVDEDLYDGVWVETGLGFDVYLPEDWVLVDITDEMADAGLVFMAGEDGGGANLTITLAEIPEEVAKDYDYEKLGEELAQTNTTAMYALLNGIPAVVFENEETKVSGFAMLTEDGFIITGVISAPSDDEEVYEAFAPYMKNIIMSVSPTEAEENEEIAE